MKNLQNLALFILLSFPVVAVAVMRVGVVINPPIAASVPEAPPDDTIFMEDSFTDTDGVSLPNHIGESARWVKHPNYTPTSSINTNRAKADSASIFMYYASTDTVADSADYSVTANVFTKSTTIQGAGPAVRVSSSANTMYFTKYFQASGQWELWKLVSGTTTKLSTFTATPLTNATYVVKLSAIGSSVTVTIDGTERMAVTDTSITDRGFAGVRGADQSSSGHQVTYIKGQNAP